MASLNDIETKVQSIIDILKSRIVKTITGILPLTFTTHTTGVADNWTIYGNAEGVGERTKNLANVEAIELVSFNNRYGLWFDEEETYTITAFNHIGTYYVYIRVYDENGAPVTDNLPLITSQGVLIERVVDLKQSEHLVVFDPLTTATAASAKAKFGRIKLSVSKGSIAPTIYIPYGYQIPLTVSQSGQTDKNYNIYIGDTPLTAGQSVSKTSTGIDIELFEGENTVSTTLYNKPEMTIKYKYNGGN